MSGSIYWEPRITQPYRHLISKDRLSSEARLLAGLGLSIFTRV